MSNDFGVPGYVPPIHFVYKCPRCQAYNARIAPYELMPCQEVREVRSCHMGCPDYEGVMVAPGSRCPHCWEYFVRKPGSGRPRTWCYGCLPALSSMDDTLYARQAVALARFKRTGKHSPSCCVSSKATYAAYRAKVREEEAEVEFYRLEGVAAKAAHDRLNGRSVDA